jgi:hypothetical protein
VAGYRNDESKPERGAECQGQALDVQIVAARVERQRKPAKGDEDCNATLPTELLPSANAKNDGC